MAAPGAKAKRRQVKQPPQVPSGAPSPLRPRGHAPASLPPALRRRRDGAPDTPCKAVASGCRSSAPDPRAASLPGSGCPRPWSPGRRPELPRALQPRSAGPPPPRSQWARPRSSCCRRPSVSWRGSGSGSRRHRCWRSGGERQPGRGGHSSSTSRRHRQKTSSRSRREETTVMNLL